MPQISVIIPVYNAEKTINDCLTSIFNQTFKDLEVIAINDGSTDSSRLILQKWQDKVRSFNFIHTWEEMAKEYIRLYNSIVR